jgi:hypothetical protein
VEKAKAAGIDALKRMIEDQQREIVEELRDSGCSRAGTFSKLITTSIGVVRITVQRMKVLGKGTFSPLLEALGIWKRRYSSDVRMKCADLASVTSYGDASKQFLQITGIHVPKRTIHAFVQQIAPVLKKENERHVQCKKVECGMADGTKTHSIYSTKNDVNVVIGYNSGKKVLLKVSVNEGWDDTAKDVNPILGRSDALVRDADRSIAKEIAYDTEHQLDLVHAVKETMIKLWGEDMPKSDRDIVSKRMKRILFTLVDSVKKHMYDRDVNAIRRRIDYTLEELRCLSKELKRNGYCKASEFIRKNSKLMVTFAELAMEDIIIPYTSNLIERLMGQVAKRCKHIWAHWSTAGLENILQIILVKYCSPEFYDRFYNAYIAGMYNREGS